MLEFSMQALVRVLVSHSADLPRCLALLYETQVLWCKLWSLVEQYHVALCHNLILVDWCRNIENDDGMTPLDLIGDVDMSI